jgi:ATP-dependent Lon protease
LIQPFLNLFLGKRMNSKNRNQGRMNRKGGKEKPSPRNEKSLNKKKTLAPKKPIPHDKGDDDDDSIDSYGNIRDLIDYEYDSEKSEDERLLSKRKAAKKAMKSIKNILKKEDSEEEEESEEEDYDEEEDEEDEDEDEEEDEGEEEDSESESDEEMNVDSEKDIEMESEENKKLPGIQINFSSILGDAMDHMIPKRHNLKKETEDVKKFVKLLTKPNDQNTIDDQIDQFKALEFNKQKQIIEALERKPNNSESSLMFKILTMNLPVETQAMVLAKYNSLQMMDPSVGEYYKTRAWLEKLTSLPLGIYKELPAKIEDGQEICSNFMMRARKCLEDAIYGQEEAKIQILQFIATKMANPNSRGLSLLLSGPPGIGKSSIIKNGIAKALDWPFQFISLGGDSDATTYTGHQPVYEGSHCGKIVNSLVAAKSMSMVLMFDELDKISQTPKGEEVQNLLIHLTDPVQNDVFEDKYLSGVPINLSKAMFVFSGNDLNKIDKILLDRMIVIELQGYNVKDKLAIAEKFLVNNALKEVHLDEKVSFSKDVIEYILENYAKDEPGVRGFKRCIEQIIQKINMLRIYNSKDMPFYIPNFTLPFIMKKDYVDLFLKKKDMKDQSFLGMYT